MARQTATRFRYPQSRHPLVRVAVYSLSSAVAIAVIAGGYRAVGHAQRHVINTDPATSVVPSPEKPAAKIAEKPVEKPAANAPEPLVLSKPAAKPNAGNNGNGNGIASGNGNGNGNATPAVLLDRPTTRPAALAIATTRPAKSGTVDAAGLFKDADAKQETDDPVAARTLLVSAMETKHFGPSEEAAAVARLGKLNDAIVFGPRKFLSDPGQIAYQVQSGDNLQKIANKYDVTVGFIQRVNNISDPRKLRLGQSLKIIKGPFHAVVNKTAFTLDLYQGQPNTAGAVLLKRLRVGLGENDSTPTGLWKIGTKLIDPTYYNSRNEGPRVVASGDPANPLGKRWLALDGVEGQAVGKESYGIHGTIDPASIGQKKSMGCIRLLDDDIKLVYDMLVKEKSTVTVIE